MDTSADPNNSLPLTEATFFILMSMARSPRHGYAILKEVAELSDGRIRLSTGTLYGALNRLLEQGWVERQDRDDPSGRPRKEYALTDLGRRVLAAETRRLESLVALARRRLVEEKP